MIEIGQNLKYPLYDLQEIAHNSITITNVSQGTQVVEFSSIEGVELAGIKSNSGFSGTMEWGMKNPTFLLPTNFFYNIINLFKRRDDIIYFKLMMNDGKIFLVKSNMSSFHSVQKRIET